MASLLVMPTVSLVQRRAGHEVGSHSAVADSKQTLLCSYMSAVQLVALLANSLAGWWWADPIGALIIAGLAVREGITTWNRHGAGVRVHRRSRVPTRPPSRLSSPSA